ncbi:MAG TPA: FecR domain-containing protein [Terriglobia bacterium]|nr:FecR domain-containing protein [Terriglobia bacterium]
MDRQNDEFEAFLKQFQLRTPGPLPKEGTAQSPRPRRRPLQWILAAAAVVAVVLLSSALVRMFEGTRGPYAKVEVAGTNSLYKTGQTIPVGEVVRSNDAEGVVLALEDGSHIEMRSQSALALESAADGIRVRLNNGSIIVSAAKQQTGHLYVQTKNVLVSVVGTVFFVNAESTGTSVAVVEGEVHVQDGASLKKLHPGEQTASDTSVPLRPVREAISWSRNALAYAALLPPPPSVAAQIQTGPGLVPFSQDPASLIRDGEKLAAAGRYHEAADLFQKALSLNRLSSIASFRLGEVRYQLGDFNNALQSFRDSLIGDLDPKWIEVWAHINIGKIYDIREQRDRAIPEYQRAISTGDDFHMAQGVAKGFLAAPFRQAQGVPSPSPPEPQPNANPDSPGKKIFYRACTTCHSAEPAAKTNFSTKAEYAALVNREINKGTEISTAEVPVLVDYLWENFGKVPRDIPVQRDAPIQRK